MNFGKDEKSSISDNFMAGVVDNIWVQKLKVIPCDDKFLNKNSNYTYSGISRASYVETKIVWIPEFQILILASFNRGLNNVFLRLSKLKAII